MTGWLEALVREYADHAVAAGHVGVVVGAVADGRTAVAGAGRTALDGGVPDGRTLFRIASLSKPFTGVALGSAVVRRELDLADLANEHLPSPVRLPDHVAITVEHLATHRSGLPRGLPDTYKDETLDDIANGLAGVGLTGPPGQAAAYSNLGATLVGLLLARRTGARYDQMLRSRITGPLGLSDIVEWPWPEQRSRLATGHDEDGAACPTPTYPLAVAAGGLYGTVDDLLRFVRAHWLGAADVPTELGAALRMASAARADCFPDNRIGLFWLIGAPSESTATRDDAVWHNGALPGYRGYLAFVPGERIGVAVLSNTARPIDRLGSALLERVAGRPR